MNDSKPYGPSGSPPALAKVGTHSAVGSSVSQSNWRSPRQSREFLCRNSRRQHDPIKALRPRVHTIDLGRDRPVGQNFAG